MPIPWRRALLTLLPRLGLEVAGVLPGSVLVSRGRAPRRRRLGPGAVVVSHRPRGAAGWYEREAGAVTWLLDGHLATLLRRCAVNCVLDVGANHGQFGRRLRRVGYRGHIVSFEPVPETFARLERAAAEDPRWTVHPYALGREAGSAPMQVVHGTLSSMLPATRFGADRYERLRTPAVQEVEVRRLDAVLDEVVAHVPDPRLYLKLDTQGYDVEAFAGLGERARELVGMQSEVAVLPIYEGMPLMCEALEVYAAAGFGISALYPVSRQSATGRVLEFDCVMVRPEAVVADGT